MIASYRTRKQFLNTYGIILVMALIAFLVRLAKYDQFTLTFNVSLFFVSIVMISFMWEALRYINRRLDETFPFEKSISGRISVQLFLGAIIGLVVRFVIYFFGEPYLPIKLD